MKPKLFAMIPVLVASVATPGFEFHAAAEEPFTIAVIPDSQNLVAYDRNTWLQQCQWIADNQTNRNIKAVIHVGDLVNDSQQPYQWSNAVAGLNILRDAGLPVILAPGNHDMDLNGLCQQMTNLTEALPQSWFTSNTNWSGGFCDPVTLAGSYLLVTNESSSYLIVALGWLPDNATVAWARGIMSQFSNCPTMFVTHCFVDDSGWGRRASWTQIFSVERSYGDLSRWWTPNRLWTDWLRSSPNLFWIISGHLYTDFNSIYFTEPADDGHLVTQSLCDYQGTIRGVSGPGMMQLLTVNGGENQCHIETFSSGSGRAMTNWNEDYTFPIHSTNQTYFSRWQLAQAAANGLLLRNGFDVTNRGGFVGTSAYRIPLTGAMATAPEGIYVNCYPAFSNMVMASDIDALTGLASLSLSAWFKGTNAPPAGLGMILAKFGGGTDGEWYLSTLDATHVRWVLVNTNNSRINLDCATPAPVLDGKWHHLAATYDGATAKLFFDGQVIGTKAFSGRIKGTRHLVCVGGLDGQYSPTNSAYTPLGWIDRIKLWSVALSEDQVTANYVHELATLNAARTNAVSTVVGTNLDLAVRPGTSYFLRFALKGASQTNIDQRMIVSWNGAAITDFSVLQNHAPDSAGWIYSAALVSSTNDIASLQVQTITDDPDADPTVATNTTSLLADVSLVPFSPPEVSGPDISEDGLLNFAWPTLPGIAYQLQVSKDFENWAAATEWSVASDTNSIVSVPKGSASSQFFRVQARW